jgi:hypothetical protein
VHRRRGYRVLLTLVHRPVHPMLSLNTAVQSRQSLLPPLFFRCWRFGAWGPRNESCSAPESISKSRFYHANWCIRIRETNATTSITRTRAKITGKMMAMETLLLFGVREVAAGLSEIVVLFAIMECWHKTPKIRCEHGLVLQGPSICKGT